LNIQYLQMSLEHLPGVVELQRACFPPPFSEELLWKEAHLRRHLQVFPEGQFVALHGKDVVASASSTRISETTWQAHRSWEETVGGFFISNFDPRGTTLYGLDISVHPDFRGLGIGRSLYNLRFELVRSLKLARYGTACRLPDFRSLHREDPKSTVESYAESVERGDRVDRTLTPLLKYGLEFLGVSANFMEDYESDNAAALLEWRP